MELAMIGLGRMGGNMARRLMRAGHRVVGYNRSPESTRGLAEEGLDGAFGLEEVAQKLAQPRIAWLMVPAGDPTEKTIAALMGILAPGDTIVDGGNTFYKDDMRRADMLRARGIHYVDVGTSGGIWGLMQGYSLMIGGDNTTVARLRPVFEALAPAPDKGWGHVGPTGAGHFVKMVHNGIEYGMMQAYAEGFEIMRAKREFDLDLHRIAGIWQHGSVVRSWLLELIGAALEADQNLANVRGYVQDSGEGRWTIQEAIDLDVPAPVITTSLFQRFASRQEESYAARLLAAVRNQFGGHAIKTR
ncbi:MAG TPA: decarboxylating 6-phosphogluconate dehydrogenase [Anaerolineae bacterium]|nr:decarboxylating 6-phosphogluconate dehydrogenase [Anaerolineae bacterium]